jgi:hypothetical protein
MDRTNLEKNQQVPPSLALSRRKPLPARWLPVICTKGGRIFEGQYATDASGVMVAYGGRVKSTPLAAMSALALAQILLAEIVGEDLVAP